MAPVERYNVSCPSDCVRCVFSPMMTDIDEHTRPYPIFCNTTAWLGVSLCLVTCGFLSTAFYLDDDYACASCTGMKGDEHAYQKDEEDYSE